MQDFMHRAGAWCVAHPELVWPLLTALITLLFKPRTPGEYAAIAARWPRVAALLQLIGALGLDVPKVVEAVGKVVTGRSDPPKKPPPAGPSIMLIGFVAILATQTTACSLFNAKTLRTILDVAQVTCIIAHQELGDADVAKVCDIADDLIPPMRKVLVESRKASAEAAGKASAQRCEGAK